MGTLERRAAPWLVLLALLAGCTGLKAPGLDLGLIPGDGGGTDEGGNDGAGTADLTCPDPLEGSDEVCARCGLTCEGGGCAQGRCLPVKVADAVRPVAVLVAGQRVYWLDERTGLDGELASIREDLDGGPQTLSIENPYPTALAASSTHLFYANANSPGIGPAGSVYARALGDLEVGAAHEPLVAQGLGAPQFLAASDEFVAWTESQSTICVTPPCTPSVGVSPAAPPFSPRDLVTGDDTPTGVAVDSADIFYASMGDGSGVGPWIRRLRLSSDGQFETTPLAVGIDAPGALAIDDQFVYWTSVPDPAPGFATATVARVDRSDPMQLPTVLTDHEDNPVGLAVDDRAVYWASSSQGQLRRMPKDGGTGSVEVLADGQDTPVGLWLTADHLYWVNRGDKMAQGSVQRLPRPPAP
jgi:hypothetical protein